jgi:hypothetical protein
MRALNTGKAFSTESDGVFNYAQHPRRQEIQVSLPDAAALHALVLAFD